MIKWLKNIGPGTLIAAAFIGPGTVTLCTLAGVNYGFDLIWAMVLSVVATIVLQEMAARTGIITQKGLAETIKNQLSSNIWRNSAVGLIFSAIVIGNAAYEAGNISGASLGVQGLFGDIPSWIAPVAIGVVAFVLLFVGSYKFLERMLIALVLVMSVSFLITALLTKPSISTLLKGMLIPRFPEGSILTIVGLIGTTVVPYNLFLHASIVKERWKNKEDLKAAKQDTVISIILGGLVSISIIVSAAAFSGGTVTGLADLAKGLEPLFGKMASVFLGLGLFAAGITSAITAPLAAAYVARSCFGWENTLKNTKFRMVWMTILLIGVLFSSLKINPIEVIKFAQVANGLLLPVIALFLLWIVNKSDVLGKYVNSKVQNGLAILIILIAMLLGFKSILSVFNII